MTRRVASTMRLPLTLSPHRLRQLWYAPLLALAMALMLLRSLVLASLFGVHAFAEFSGGILVSSTFCMLGCLGLQSMLQRELPVNLVRRQELRGMVRAAQCTLVSVVCCLVGVLGTSFGAPVAGMTPALLAVGLLHGMSQQVFVVATLESRSRGDALRYARQNFARAVAALTLCIAAALWTGSALVALAIDAVVTIGLSSAYFRRSLRYARISAAAICVLAWRRLRRVRWGSALTLMAIMIVGFGLLNADRWVAADRLGAVGFAHYSFAWILLSIAQSAQAVINAAVYPMVARRFAEHGRQAAFSVCMRASALVLVAGSVAAVPLSFLLGHGIERWYPRYSDASTLVPLFLAIAVLRVSDFWTTYLLITGFEARLLAINLASAAVGLIAWVCFLASWLADAPATLMQIGWLAALLTTMAYGVTAVASWRARQA